MLPRTCHGVEIQGLVQLGLGQRAALHVALRAPRAASIVVDGENVVPQVHEMLDRMAAFCDHVRRGAWFRR